MLLGGFLILLTAQVKIWRPENKEEDTLSLWRVRGIQLLALEGVVMGIGWGMFDIAIPALGTLEGMQNRVGTIFAVMAAFNVVGGLIAGTLSRKVSALKAFRLNYLLWAILSIPLAFTHFDWSLGVTVAFLAFLGGAQQVFYWEITEAVRPKGTAVQALAWLWTIEGSAAALAIAAGGFISEHLSPRYCRRGFAGDGRNFRYDEMNQR
jgi:MFS family permease